ncbi:PfaD family polyunsaturated fatty acid/polyketide biosynthesis protein [Amycolatopsis pithecellobii]|uniref:PfaD family polyunsaturated fatty acid/polyketide biosynthesis protein n=1 Tax=Amycolatopsis pithecellobii TaxID=664692 RepID=A0A6N7Z1H8_9PSEU|nr:PfaD family polyunsaturated fatty acid/polyketide biosynthesis protein [Amycolatopsis pithecellobii]MTD58222.1 PfaD family polyunsaturated fatty acid/polyketide biosynthesis protein [Amycolatopsis pithecellobii]
MSIAITSPALARDEASIYQQLSTLDSPVFVVRDGGGIAVTTDAGTARRAQVLAAVPALPPESLGDPDFRAHHEVRHAYQAGAMANGIASVRLVTALAGAGFLASFGAAGVVPAKIDDALAAIRHAVGGKPFSCNLIHSPSEPALERAIVDACLRNEVRCVEASAFIDLTPQVVKYRLAGLGRDRDGRIVTRNKVIAKVSRAEVAERFLRPAPAGAVRELLAAGEITAEQAELAAAVPMADDITAEADSGGHTDRRPLPVLVPSLIALRDRVWRESAYPRPVRIGAAGGIGTPAAAAAAFALGASYVVTGSINQASLEADQSGAAKRLLAQAGSADTEMAPSSDMFELGVDVQVLKRGTMFASRARRLYDAYRAFDGIGDIPAADRADLEQRIFQRSFDEVWTDCVRYFRERDPEQIDRAEGNPKRRMALIFRWYLGRSSGWSMAEDPARTADYQIWCGPAMGAFNEWVAGTYLAARGHRHVAELATQIMRGAAFTTRVNQLRAAGVRLPAACSTYVPAPLTEVTR